MIDCEAPSLTGNTEAASKVFMEDVIQAGSITGSYDVPGGMVLALLVAWVMIYLCIRNGAKSVGKVVKFTVFLPVIFLLILAIKGFTMPGAGDGIKAYLVPDWAALANPDVPRRHAAIGDVRVLAGGEAKPAPGSAPAARGSGVAPVVALYRYRIPEAEKTAARPAEFASPVQRYVVEDARLPDAIRAGVQRQEQSYRVHLTIPLQELGLQPDTLPGRRLRADFGVIFGDAEGTINVARSYWANPETGLVNDEPGEMQPQPHRWGFVTFEAETDR